MAAKDYSRRQRELAEVHFKIEAIRSRFRQRKRELDVRPDGGRGGDLPDSHYQLFAEFKDESDALERLQKDYVRLHDELRDLRGRFE